MGNVCLPISIGHALISLIRFHAYNIGLLSSRASSPLFTPCTPAAVIRLLESTAVPISGANAVVLGRSDIVGNPVVALLRNKDATVTQCHSRTKNLEQIVSTFFPIGGYFSLTTSAQVKQADILVAAIGQAEFVKGSWIKPGAVVIDVGINSVPGIFCIVSFLGVNLTHDLPRCNQEVGSTSCWRCRVRRSSSPCFPHHPRPGRCWSDDCCLVDGKCLNVCYSSL